MMQVSFRRFVPRVASAMARPVAAVNVPQRLRHDNANNSNALQHRQGREAGMFHHPQFSILLNIINLAYLFYTYHMYSI